MASSAPSTRTIEVDEQVYDVLARTARSRDTDINDVLKYLLEAPAVTTVSSQDDDEE
jgi:negative regulator of replication initiation